MGGAVSWDFGCNVYEPDVLIHVGKRLVLLRQACVQPRCHRCRTSYQNLKLDALAGLSSSMQPPNLITVLSPVILLPLTACRWTLLRACLCCSCCCWWRRTGCSARASPCATSR